MVIAKLARLARNVHFISELVESGVEYSSICYVLSTDVEERFGVQAIGLLLQVSATVCGGSSLDE